MSAGDIELKWEGEIVAAIRLPPLHGALDRIIESVERETWQQAFGAFTQR